MHSHAATIRVPAREDAFEAALEGLTRLDAGLMQQQQLPPLYESGVRYRDEKRDVWKHAVDVAGEGYGDCEDLAAYRAAELRVSGEDPDARVAVYKSGPNRYHAVVARGDGQLEDPSRALGMGQRMNRQSDTANVVGDDPTPGENAITFEVVTIPGGWGRRAGYRGYIRIPFGKPTAPGATPQALMTVGPQATSVPEAAKAAAKTAATAFLTNPAVTTALQAVPGGPLAAAALADPKIQSAIKTGLSKLKFW